MEAVERINEVENCRTSTPPPHSCSSGEPSAIGRLAYPYRPITRDVQVHDTKNRRRFPLSQPLIFTSLWTSRRARFVSTLMNRAENGSQTAKGQIEMNVARRDVHSGVKMDLSFVQYTSSVQYSYHRVMNLSFVQNVLYRQFSSYHHRHETVIVRIVLNTCKVAKLYSCGLIKTDLLAKEWIYP